jgi:hypothetical protein
MIIHHHLKLSINGSPSLTMFNGFHQKYFEYGSYKPMKMLDIICPNYSLVRWLIIHKNRLGLPLDIYMVYVNIQYYHDISHQMNVI